MRSAAALRLALALTILIALPGGGLGVPAVASAQGIGWGGAAGQVWAGQVWAGVLRAPVAADEPGGGLVPIERLIVRFQPGAARTAQVDAHQSARALRADALPLEGAVRVEVSAGETANALAAYNARPDVMYAEPDYRVRALYTPNDPRFGEQWGLQKISAPSAWDVSRGAGIARVAVLDCGIFSQGTGRTAGDGQAGHPDLRGRVVLERDFTRSSTGFDDYCDHGTHVAGIVAANADNGLGVAGLAHQTALLNGKVLDDNGDGFNSDIIAGIIWAADNGARVINMSLGRNGACSSSERDAISYAWQRGVVVVAAAGNSGLSSSGAPANCANVISVASTTSSDARSSFSNYGSNVDVAAPGSGILSTTRDGSYKSFNGTSMASPHVAALAALIWTVNSGGTAQSVVDRIAATSDQIGGTGTSWAWGRINAGRALGGGSPQPPPPAPQPAPPPVSCSSPRPPVQVTTAPTGTSSMSVTVRAGAGQIRDLTFREIRNAALDVGSQHGATAPFSVQPNPQAAELTFVVSQRTPGQATHVDFVVTDDCGPWGTFVGAGPNGLQHGTLTGIVRSATTSQPIAGATIAVAQRGVQTDTNGWFSLNGVPTGPQSIAISAPGYTGQTQQATIQPNQAVNITASLTPTVQETEITIRLTWGNSPADLDAHLSGPVSASGQRFHAYWNNPNPVGHAALTADDRDGGGPETIVIRRSTSNGPWVAGEYRFWSHNYSGFPGYGSSSARVTVTRGSTQLGVYDVGNASGSASLPLWQSVSLTLDANGNATLSPVQQFKSGGSGTVLRFEEGAGSVVEWPAAGKP